MDIRPLDAPFGCEITGLDVNAGLSPEAVRRVEEAIAAPSS